jgi:hypothetical protein
LRFDEKKEQGAQNSDEAVVLSAEGFKKKQGLRMSAEALPRSLDMKHANKEKEIHILFRTRAQTASRKRAQESLMPRRGTFKIGKFKRQSQKKRRGAGPRGRSDERQRGFKRKRVRRG